VKGARNFPKLGHEIFVFAFHAPQTMLFKVLFVACAASVSGLVCPASMPACGSRIASSRMANVGMSAVVDEVMEKLKTMTLLEASELVKAIEETFDVDASAGGGGGMMMAAPAAGGAAPGAAAAEEKTEFDLTLESFPADKKIAVLKIVRGITGLGLKEAKEFVESVPKALKEGASSKEDCDAAKADLEAAGAVCSMK
jgi:large subunit ribosomal protein L7/L12